MPDEEQLFRRHIKDLCVLAEKRSCPVFSGFLTEHEQSAAAQTARAEGSPFAFSGGYDAAERKIFAAGETEVFPVEAITARFRKADTLTHRDFLGALMALGIKRELIGDILVGEGYALIFCSEQIAPMITGELDKVGRVGIKTELGINAPLPEQEFETTDCTVASLRLDCVVAAATKLSREKAVKLISAGLVQADGTAVCENSREIEISSKLSIRGYGKFLLDEIGAQTKKGKTHIQIKKYL